MLKRIKTLFKDNLIFFAIAITLVILYLSLMKMPNTGVEIKHLDKGYHCIAYFVLTLTWLLSFYKKSNKKYLIVFFCIILGIIIEVLQDTITVYRTADYFDVLANSVGVLFALVIFNIFLRKKTIN